MLLGLCRVCVCVDLYILFLYHFRGEGILFSSCSFFEASSVLVGYDDGYACSFARACEIS